MDSHSVQWGNGTWGMWQSVVLLGPLHVFQHYCTVSVQDKQHFLRFTCQLRSRIIILVFFYISVLVGATLVEAVVWQGIQSLCSPGGRTWVPHQFWWRQSCCDNKAFHAVCVSVIALTKVWITVILTVLWNNLPLVGVLCLQAILSSYKNHSDCKRSCENQMY